MVLSVCSIAAFNSFGIATTKYASAAQRSTIDTSRTLLIWIFSVLLGLEEFVAWEIPGFILLVVGTLMYNEIVIFPCLGFNQYTKDALAKREGKGEGDTANYMATSPHAAYDANRNVRGLQNKMKGMAMDGGDDFDLNQSDNLLSDKDRVTSGEM